MNSPKPKTQNLKTDTKHKVLSVHQPQYIPWLGYLEKIANSDIFIYLDSCQYKHREFQNRNRILTNNGELWLAVPVLVKGRRDQLIKDVMINRESDWQKSHWRSIEMTYKKAPHFEEHREFFQKLYLEDKWTSLMDLNIYITDYLLDHFAIKTNIAIESEIGSKGLSNERIIELCKNTSSDIYLSGAGAKVYMDERLFEKNGITVEYQDFHHPVYDQFNNKSEFLPYMSSLDYIFNTNKTFLI